MKIAVALIGIAVAAALVVSATMGADTLMPGDQGKKKFPGGAIDANGRARLLPAKFLPPTLKGTNFKPGENVRVELEGVKAKRVKADASGAFTVSFGGRAERCNGMTATAVGDKGSRAAFQLSEFMCAASGTQQ